MNRSEQINELATALAQAQGQVEGAKRDADNPFFKSKYADLASVWAACRAALGANGLAVAQSPYLAGIDDSGATVGVTTLLTHSSGQWLENDLVLPVSKPDAQGFGSAITYARRYALAAMVGIAPADDDAEAAVGRNASGETSRPVARSAYPAKKPGKPEWSKPANRAKLECYNLLRQAIRVGLYDPAILDGSADSKALIHSEMAKLAKLEKWPTNDDDPNTFEWAAAAKALQEMVDANTPPPVAA